MTQKKKRRKKIAKLYKFDWLTEPMTSFNENQMKHSFRHCYAECSHFTALYYIVLDNKNSGSWIIIIIIQVNRMHAVNDRIEAKHLDEII